jgi:hypothetical protein
MADLSDREVANSESVTREEKEPYGLAIEGPVDLPFDHHDIQVYIDNLFLEGLLHSVTHEHGHALSKTWVSIGVRTDPSEDRSRRLTKLVESLQASIPAEDAKHTAWFHFARGWAELKVMSNEDCGLSSSDALSVRIGELTRMVDARFARWVQRRFPGLTQLPPVPPVMVHHIPRFLAHSVLSTQSSPLPAKLALLVLDGLALDQWLIVREMLSERQPGFRFQEQTIFAWIPSPPSRGRPFLPASLLSFSRTASRPLTKSLRCGRSSGLIKASRQTRSCTPRGWATAA